jgi:hypothetical protein
MSDQVKFILQKITHAYSKAVAVLFDDLLDDLELVEPTQIYQRKSGR